MGGSPSTLSARRMIAEGTLEQPRQAPRLPSEQLPRRPDLLAGDHRSLSPICNARSLGLAPKRAGSPNRKKASLRRRAMRAPLAEQQPRAEEANAANEQKPWTNKSSHNCDLNAPCDFGRNRFPPPSSRRRRPAVAHAPLSSPPNTWMSRCAAGSATPARRRCWKAMGQTFEDVEVARMAANDSAMATEEVA